jgi:hypothetical protein
LPFRSPEAAAGKTRQAIQNTRSRRQQSMLT